MLSFSSTKPTSSVHALLNFFISVSWLTFAVQSLFGDKENTLEIYVALVTPRNVDLMPQAFLRFSSLKTDFPETGSIRF